MKIYVKTYGIACVEEHDGKCEIVAEVPNVSINRAQVDLLVKLFNHHGLAPEHLEDVIEDLMCIM